MPLPLDTDAIRRALDSPDPAVALAVALVAFHALTAKQLAQLQLTDIVDGRLTLDGRDIPLAGPVQGPPRRLARLPRPDLAGQHQPPPLRRPAQRAPASPRSASNSPGHEPTSVPKPCEKTASSKKSTPPAETSAASATSSASPSKPPCATPSPSGTPTSNTPPSRDCLLTWTDLPSRTVD